MITTDFKYQLERGSKKYTCPACGKPKCFKRYVDTYGRHIADTIGRCDREQNCGYHGKPSDYFGAVRDLAPVQQRLRKVERPKGYDYHDISLLFERLDGYEANPLAQFLVDLFPEVPDVVELWIAAYWIGTYRHYGGNYALLPTLDSNLRFCRGKLMRFDPATGKRDHAKYGTSSLRSMLKLKDFNYDPAMFGEHLLPKYPNFPVAIVESEKSALIAAICNEVFPPMVWLASGSKSSLNAERIARACKGREVLLYPDAGCYEDWQKIAKVTAAKGIAITVSRLVEDVSNGKGSYDIADYLIAEQRRIQAHNWKVAKYEEMEEREAIRLEGCGIL